MADVLISSPDGQALLAIEFKRPPSAPPKGWRTLTAADFTLAPPSDPELIAALDWADANWRDIVQD